MTNKRLFITGLLCIAVPLTHFLFLYLASNDPERFVFLLWTLPFAFVGALLLVVAVLRFVAMAAGLRGWAANLIGGAIALGQWFAPKATDLSVPGQLISDAIAIGGLVLLLGSLMVWWRTEGLRP